MPWHSQQAAAGLGEHLEHPLPTPPSPTPPSFEPWSGLVWCGWLPRQMVHWVVTGWGWDMHGQWCGWWRHTDMLWLAPGTLFIFTKWERVMPDSWLCISNVFIGLDIGWELVAFREFLHKKCDETAHVDQKLASSSKRHLHCTQQFAF